MASHRSTGGNYVVRELNIDIDMGPVDEADFDTVNSVIYTVCNLEDPMPKLTGVIHPASGVYNIVFRNFNKNVRGRNCYNVFFGPDRDPAMDMVDDWYMNADRGTFVVRVWQQGHQPQRQRMKRVAPIKKKRKRDPRAEERGDHERY